MSSVFLKTPLVLFRCVCALTIRLRRCFINIGTGLKTRSLCWMSEYIVSRAAANMRRMRSMFYTRMEKF